MNDLVITVAAKRAPAASNRSGTIKDTTGKFWDVWQPLYDQMVEGQTYRVNKYAQREYNLKTYYTIKDVTNIQTGGSQPVNYAQGGGSNANLSPQPAYGTMWAQRPAGLDDGQRRLDIFVCGAFNNIMANQNIQPLQMTFMEKVHVLQELKRAWLAVFGPSPLPSQPRRDDPISSGPTAAPNSSDMNDGIPF